MQEITLLYAGIHFYIFSVSVMKDKLSIITERYTQYHNCKIYSVSELQDMISISNARYTEIFDNYSKLFSVSALLAVSAL